MLEGLHFDVLLKMNWLKAFGAVIDVVNRTIRIAEEKIPYKAWPEPASFYVNKEQKCIAKN